MALSRDAIGDAALRLVQAAGLSSLSMRGVATELHVAPGALYWHVDSKQELLALLAERILAAPPFADGAESAGAEGAGAATGAAVGAEAVRSAHELAVDLRDSLLAVRDGAEIVSFSRALHPDAPVPLQPFRRVLSNALPEREADWAARTLVHFVLGSVAEQQNYAELARAGIRKSGASGSADAADPTGDAARHGQFDDESARAAFAYGVDAILRGAGA